MTDRLSRTPEDQEIILTLAQHRAIELRCVMLADGLDPIDHLDEVTGIGVRIALDYYHPNPHIPPKPHAPHPDSPWAKESD
jgi:hypothetical protein